MAKKKLPTVTKSAFSIDDWLNNQNVQALIDLLTKGAQRIEYLLTRQGATFTADEKAHINADLATARARVDAALATAQ